MGNAVEVVDLYKSFNDSSEALRGVSFTVPKGGVFAYLGRNGAGKSTTIRVLTTLARPTSGEVSVLGYDVAREPTRVREHVGATLQESAVNPVLTPREHLQMIAAFWGQRSSAARERARELLDLFGLASVADRRLGTLSGGTRRRVDIATALINHPRLLFLDEPTTGLDPQSRRALWAEIGRLRDAGTTIFLTTQYLEEADELADLVAVIDAGRLLAIGAPLALKQQHSRTTVDLRLDDARDLANLQAHVGPVELLDGARAVRIDLSASDSSDDVITLITSIRAANVGFSVIRIAEPTLEDAFIRLTGDAIETHKADPSDIYLDRDGELAVAS